MSFTGFLFLIIVIVTIAQALKSLLNSRTARIWLISYREHLHQKEVEKEMQKTRQRTIEEIKNPDRILEIVMKMRRGEEVKIPLVAFDYIYRNMKKFSIVDKEGRIAIINHEDYFRFKEEALSLIESNKNNTMSAKQILEDLSKRVAENPIEITEYEDGTIVKVDHVARTAEVSKPNGEKFFIDHKTETMISQNLIETQEQKEQKAPRKDYKKDAELKQKTEEVKLLQSKVNRLEKEQPANSSHRKEKQSTQSTQADKELVHINKQTIDDKEDDGSLFWMSQEIDITNTPISQHRFFRKRIDDRETTTHTEQTSHPMDNNHGIQNNVSSQPIIKIHKSYLEYQDLQQYLTQAIDYKNLIDFIKKLCNEFNSNDLERIKLSLTQHKNDFSSSSTLSGASEHFSMSNSSNIFTLYDDKIACILINIHWLFLKLCTLLDEKSIELFFKDFYADADKSFVNNDALSEIILHVNNKSIFALGAKIFMQEEHNGKKINFHTVKIKTERQTYQGQFIYLFTSNNFSKTLIQDFESKMKKENYVIDESAEKGEKITLKALLR